MVDWEKLSKACLTKAPLSIEWLNQHLFTKHLSSFVVFIFLQIAFFPLKSQTTTLFLAQNDLYTSFCVTVFWISVCVCVYSLPAQN